MHVRITPPGWQEVIRAMENSNYFESLDAKAKERYREKLSCVGLSIHGDPYLPTNEARFVNDMATWPRIEFGHISCLLQNPLALPKVKQYKIA